MSIPSKVKSVRMLRKVESARHVNWKRTEVEQATLDKWLRIPLESDAVEVSQYHHEDPQNARFTETQTEALGSPSMNTSNSDL